MQPDVPSPLVDIPTLAFDHIARFLDQRGLVSLERTCSGVRGRARDDAIWRGVVARDYPLAAPALDVGCTWPHVRRAASWARCQQRWSGKLRVRPAGCVARRVSPTASGPLFCVNAAGGGAFVVAGRDGTVAYVQGPVGATVPDGGVAVVGEWGGCPEGMLGLSVDIEAQTVVAGGFDGSLRAWKLNAHEFVSVAALPAKRLKAILQQKGVPFDDIHEKAEFLTRIRNYNALPIASPLKSFSPPQRQQQQQQQPHPHHAAPVISVAHVGDLVLSGSNDATAALWSLSTGERARSFECDGAGVDAVCLDVRTRTAVTGSKDGVVRTWDIEAGARIASFDVSDTGPGCWVWAVKTGTSYVSSALAETPPAGAATAAAGGGGGGGDAGAAAAPHETGGYLGDGRYIFAGGTDGVVRLLDTRARGVALASDAAVASSQPIAGLAPMLADNRFVTSGFDGVVRIWDTRRFAPVAMLRRPAGVRRAGGGAGGMEEEGRLTRCDVTAEVVAAGAMDGTLLLWDLRADRADP